METNPPSGQQQFPPPVPPAPPAPVPPLMPPPAAAIPPADSAAASGSGKAIAIVIAIIATCVLVVAALGVAIYFVAQSAIRSIEDQGVPLVPTTADEQSGPEDVPEILPLVTGEPGPAVAADPTVCPDECFAYDVFGAIGLESAEYEALGTTEHVEKWGDYANTTPGKQYTYSAKYWADGEGTPTECFVTYSQVPLAARYDERPVAPDDVIAYTGYHTSLDEYSALQETARLFTDSALAEAHMATFKELIAGCPGYEIGTGADYWTADVTPAPAFDLPDSVSAVGWVEDSPFGRYYTVDLQRANLVVRTSLSTDGGVTEEGYRAYVEALARQLAEIVAE